VSEKYPGAGIAHHNSDFFPVFEIVAVNGTAITGWLPPSKRTMIDPFKGIIRKGLTIRTENAF